MIMFTVYKKGGGGGVQPPETQEKLIKDILHVMLSAGHYRSAEKFSI